MDQNTGRRVATGVVRWTAVILLSLLYYTTCGMLLLAALVLGSNSLPPGMELDAIWRYASAAVLVTAAVLVFIFFPRLVRKLTGRDVIAGSPYGGLAGSGDCG